MGRHNKKSRKSSSSIMENKIHKFMGVNKKMLKSKKTIRKVFDRLRNETQDNISLEECSSSHTVIELSGNCINRNQIATPVKSNTRSSLIVINDDDDLVVNLCKEPLTPRSELNSSPIHCSTPIPNIKKSLKQFNSNIQSAIINNNSSVQNFNSREENITREINKDSYLTIDLTTESCNASNTHLNTVIDLANNTDTRNDVTISQTSSMSGDSQVTVLHNRRSKIKGKQVEKFINGIAKLNSAEKGKLLEVIAQKIFHDSDSTSWLNIRNVGNAPVETAEDSFIREVILGQAPSRNSIGSNIYNPQRDTNIRSGLRMVVIDGSNVAMEHSMGKVFSVKGLKICIEYFVHRGHIVKAFVPQFRCQFGKSTDGRLLDTLQRQGLVVYTPSRKVQDKVISSYDDRYIIQCAAEFDGVIVSRDNYRDLYLENPRWRHVIENRLLQFTWVGDLIMFPKDPLGRHGPTLEEFLKHPTTFADHSAVL